MRATADSAALTGFFGLFLGALALVGVQIVLVIGFWIFFTRVLGRPFHLPIALVLTGFTNPLTVTPIYTLYFVTACSATACSVGERAVETVVDAVMFRADFQVLGDSLAIFGITLLGSVMYAIPLGIFGYVVGRQIGLQLEKRRAARRRSRSAKPIDAVTSSP